MPNNNNKIWRWIALISLLINIIFNYYSNINPFNGQTVGEVSDQYPTLFTPAGYAFSIWGLIYLSLLIYAIYQLLPSQRSKTLYDKLSIPFIIINFLSILWILLFVYEYLGISSITIVLMLICAIYLFGTSKKHKEHDQQINWISIPFALYAGWLSVATIAGISIWLTSLGWRGEGLGEANWAILMVVVSFIVGVIILFKFKDIIFPTVISWALIAIHVERLVDESSISITSLVMSIILIILIIFYSVRYLKHNLSKFK